MSPHPQMYLILLLCDHFQKLDRETLKRRQRKERKSEINIDTLYKLKAQGDWSRGGVYCRFWSNNACISCADIYYVCWPGETSQMLLELN